VSLAPLAHAAPSTQDRANAQTLFETGVALLAKGDFVEACPKLEESQRLDPGIGTQFQLARCYEGQGRVASAWILYMDVADAAKTGGQGDRERVARQKAESVAARLPRLQIDVAPSSRRAEVKRDGEIVGAPQWGAAFPVDPGKHVVTATLAGFKPFEVTVEAKEGATARVAIPELAALPRTEAPPAASAATPVTSSPPVEPKRAGPQRTIAVVVGGAGVVGLGVGLVLGLSAKSKYDGASCPDGRCAQPDYDTRSDAIKTANLGTIVGTVGLVAAGAGVVLWLTAPSGDAPAVGVSPGAVTLRGRF
jgi:hypothetical protein